MYIGRFAPSPTGPLHFGSLITAVGSYLEARSQAGQWLLRIEDIDSPRAMRGAVNLILKALDTCEFEWDGPVIFQSQRTQYYQAALNTLTAQKLSYACNCSRRQLTETGPAYPGTCRNAQLDPSVKTCAIRVITHNEPIGFTDKLQGYYFQCLQSEIGDFQILRRDSLYAYHLAVVVDDAKQGITDIVRGSDLLNSTPRQIYLQQQLGFPTPRYLHLPVAVDKDGQKLSKQTRAKPINLQQPTLSLWHALTFLDQQPPLELMQQSPADIWSWAFKHWATNRISPCLNKICPEIKSAL